MIYKIGLTFCFANWVQNKGSLSLFCIAPGAFIGRNMVHVFYRILFLFSGHSRYSRIQQTAISSSFDIAETSGWLSMVLTVLERKASENIVFSSPEHMLKVSFCGHPISVVLHQYLPCGHTRGHNFCSIDLKFGQNVCLDKISDEFEFGSLGVKK